MTSLESVIDENRIKSYMKNIHKNFDDDILVGIHESVLFSHRDIEIMIN